MKRTGSERMPLAKVEHRYSGGRLLGIVEDVGQPQDPAAVLVIGETDHVGQHRDRELGRDVPREVALALPGHPVEDLPAQRAHAARPPRDGLRGERAVDQAAQLAVRGRVQADQCPAPPVGLLVDEGPVAFGRERRVARDAHHVVVAGHDLKVWPVGTAMQEDRVLAAQPGEELVRRAEQERARVGEIH